MGQRAKDVFDGRAEVADGVSSAFPEEQIVVGVAVEGASSCDLVVEFVMEAAVVEAVMATCSLGFGRKIGFGSKIGFGRKSGAVVLGAVLGAVLGVADIDEVIVVTKVAVNGVDWAESWVQRWAGAVWEMVREPPAVVVVGVEVVARVLNLGGWIAKKDYVNEVQLELVLELFPAYNMPGTELINSQLSQNIAILLARDLSNHFHPSIHHKLCQVS